MLSPKGFIDTITLEFKSQENVVPPSLSSFSAAVAKKNLPKTPHGHMVSQIANQVWKFTKEKTGKSWFTLTWHVETHELIT